MERFRRRSERAHNVRQRQPRHLDTLMCSTLLLQNKSTALQAILIIRGFSKTEPHRNSVNGSRSKSSCHLMVRQRSLPPSPPQDHLTLSAIFSQEAALKAKYTRPTTIAELKTRTQEEIVAVTTEVLKKAPCEISACGSKNVYVRMVTAILRT